MRPLLVAILAIAVMATAVVIQAKGTPHANATGSLTLRVTAYNSPTGATIAGATVTGSDTGSSGWTQTVVTNGAGYCELTIPRTVDYALVISTAPGFYDYQSYPVSVVSVKKSWDVLSLLMQPLP